MTTEAMLAQLRRKQHRGAIVRPRLPGRNIAGASENKFERFVTVRP